MAQGQHRGKQGSLLCPERCSQGFCTLALRAQPLLVTPVCHSASPDGRSEPRPEQAQGSAARVCEPGSAHLPCTLKPAPAQLLRLQPSRDMAHVLFLHEDGVPRQKERICEEPQMSCSSAGSGRSCCPQVGLAPTQVPQLSPGGAGSHSSPLAGPRWGWHPLGSPGCPQVGLAPTRVPRLSPGRGSLPWLLHPAHGGDALAGILGWL